MPVRKKSALYNDPAIGAIFDNLGSMFAPQKATDTYAYAKARAEQQSMDFKNRAAALLNDPNATVDQQDRVAYLAGLYNPTQGVGARNMADARSRDNNTADNARALAQTGLQQKTELTKFFQAPQTVSTGQTTYLSPQYQQQSGLAPVLSGNIDAKPGDRIFTPGPTGAVGAGQTFDGSAKPLTESEQKAIDLAALPQPERRMVAMQGVKTGNYVGPGGLPITAFDTVAADQGMAAAATPVAPSANAFNVQTPDGKRTMAVQLPNGAPVDAVTREPIAAGSSRSEIVGSADETKIGAGPQNSVDQRLIDIQLANRAADDLLGLVNSNEGSQGIVGQIRGTVQDTVASGTALGKLLKVPVAENLKDIQAGRIDPEVARQLTNYDPSIPAITVAENNVIAHMAKLQSGDSRISNDRFNQLKSAVGSGWLGNADKTRAVLGQFKQSLEGQRQVLAPLSSDAAKLAPAPIAAPAAPVRDPNEGAVAKNAAGDVLIRRGGKWVTQQ